MDDPRFVADDDPQELLRTQMDDQEWERVIRAEEKALLEGHQEVRPPLQILCQGLNLRGEEKERIESEIRRVIVEEISREKRAWLQGLIEEQEPPQPGDYADTVALGEVRLGGAVGGLNLPRAAVRRIEARVQRRIQPTVERFVDRQDPSADTCVCAYTTGWPEFSFTFLQPDGTYAPVIPENIPPWGLTLLLPPQPCPAFVSCQIYPNVIRMFAQRLPALSPDEMIVGLRIETDWAKEIEGVNFCYGRQIAVFQDQPSAVPTEMMIRKPGCGPGYVYTINFRRPGFLGIWGTVGYPNTDNFWAAAGGYKLTFKWVADESWI